MGVYHAIAARHFQNKIGKNILISNSVFALCGHQVDILKDKMGEVTRFFCCTTNIIGCKIFGGIQAVLNAVYLALIIYAQVLVNDGIDQLHRQYAGLINYRTRKRLANLSATSNIVLSITMAIYSLAILFSLMLIAGAMKRNACLVKTWMVFNALAILAYAYGSFFNGKWKNLGGLAVAVWSELIAFGALKEISLDTSNQPNPVQAPSLGASYPTTNPQPPQSGLPTYTEAKAQSQLPYPMTEMAAPTYPTLQQPAGHI